MTMMERLREQGHTVTGEFCEKCWDQAELRAAEDTSKTKYDHYQDITAEVESEADR